MNCLNCIILIIISLSGINSFNMFYRNNPKNYIKNKKIKNFPRIKYATLHNISIV